MLDSRAQREGQPSMGSALQAVRERPPGLDRRYPGGMPCPPGKGSDPILANQN